MNRLKEIETRMASIKKELAVDGADLDSLEIEINALKEERKLIGEAIEKRKKMIADVTNNTHATIITDFNETPEERKSMVLTKDNVLQSKEYRSAWAKSLMQQPLSDIEQRALGTALTTTSTTYIGATAEVNGVNNGGLFIPTEVNLELMNEISLASPFFADVSKTGVVGFMKFPYRKSGGIAEIQTEGIPNKDGQLEWAELTLTTLEVSETIRVTWKLEAMSVDGFISYITKELADQITEKIVTGVIYGNGSNDLTGATVGAFDGKYTIGDAAGNVPDVLGAIEDGLKLLSIKKKIGAKIYVAQDIIETISFLRDSNGNFVYSPINGGGINSIATYAVNVDPFLHAGDFIIGNAKYYRFNTNEGLSIARDSSGKQRINDYTGYEIVSGAPVPNSFVYAKKV